MPITVNQLLINDSMSRKDMLNWVNKTLSSNYKRIEELCTGAAYCQLLNIILPGSIPFRKVRLDAKLEYEYQSNWRIIQLAFTKFEIEKNIPIDKLIKGRFQDNFEFLQWFKKFYDSKFNLNTLNSENPALSTNVKLLKPTTRPSVNSLKLKLPTSISTKKIVKPISSRFSMDNILEDSKSTTTQQFNDLKTDRDNAYRKLRKIEKLCDDMDKNDECKIFTKKLQNILYATETEMKERRNSFGEFHSMSSKENDPILDS